jgi:tripartite-type tricarboxylate transporter receptor subunit TctC
MRVASAEIYPARPIRLVVPFPPGGVFDALARPWVEEVKPLLGTMIVENIGGAGSSLGAAAVARARPDGYTILLGGTLPHVNETLLKSRPLYDPVKDLYPIAGLAVTALALAVHPSVPAQNLKEFVAHAKTHPGTLSYAHAGVGATSQLDRRDVQIAGGAAGARAGALPRCRAGDRGPDQRTGCHGRGGCNRAIARISPVRTAADSRGNEPEASRCRARASDGGGCGLSGG